MYTVSRNKALIKKNISIVISISSSSNSSSSSGSNNNNNNNSSSSSSSSGSSSNILPSNFINVRDICISLTVKKDFFF